MYVPRQTAIAMQEHAKARQIEAQLELERLQARRRRTEMINSLPPDQAALVVGLSILVALFSDKKR